MSLIFSGKSPIHKRKALILAENSALLGGDTAKLLIFHAESIVRDAAKGSFNQSVMKKIQTLNALVQENNNVYEELKISLEKRLKLEKKFPNYEERADWKALNSKVKELSDKDSKASKAFNSEFINAHEEIKSILASDGIDLITYDAPDDGSLTGASPETLKQSIKELPSNCEYDIINVGGGHGNSEVFSGLKKSFYEELVTEIANKHIHGKVCLLGSCEGFIHSGSSSLLLKDQGIIVGYVGDCTNNFICGTIDYLRGEEQNLIVIENSRSEETEGHAKDGSLAVREGNDVYIFELAPIAARNEDNVKHWSNTFYEVFKSNINLENKAAPIENVIMCGQNNLELIEQSLLRNIFERSDFLVEGKIEPARYYEALLLMRDFTVTSLEEAKQDEDYDEEFDIDLQKVKNLAPKLHHLSYSVEAKERIQALNRAITHIVPPLTSEVKSNTQANLSNVMAIALKPMIVPNLTTDDKVDESISRKRIKSGKS